MSVDTSILPTDLTDRFEALYGVPPSLVASAPGRVNLIGEHTDYNEGFVLPVAINRRTWAAFGPRPDGRFVCRSLEMDEVVDVGLEELEGYRNRGWFSYVAGVASLLRHAGIPVSGTNCLISSTVPRASGLSSSAALEVSTTVGLAALSGCALTTLQTIRFAQQAEWDWAGVQCGIMDQFIATIGKSASALFIDCRSLHHELVPLDPRLHVVVCDTNVPRSLSASAYNQRREECAGAVRALETVRPGIRTLRDASAEDLHAAGTALPSVPGRRARHVVSENQRVLDAVDTLWQRDHATLGRLLNDSHDSLSKDYEVSCSELDIMAEICRTVPGVFGARMTGAGFGGCVLALSTEAAVPALTAEVGRRYEERTGRPATVIPCNVGDGARVIRTA